MTKKQHSDCGVLVRAHLQHISSHHKTFDVLLKFTGPVASSKCKNITASLAQECTASKLCPSAIA